LAVPVHDQGVGEQKSGLGGGISLELDDGFLSATLKPKEESKMRRAKTQAKINACVDNSNEEERIAGKTYVRRVMELILPQKEKKSVTVFSLALAEMLVT
jgi:hypothetical protein